MPSVLWPHWMLSVISATDLELLNNACGALVLLGLERQHRVRLL